MKRTDLLKWIALVVVCVNVLFNFFYDRLLGLPSMATVTAEYNFLFNPAGYAFSIWSVIYASWIIYMIYALRRSQRLAPVHILPSGLIIISSLLGICWIIAFTTQRLWLSVVIIAAMLIVSMILFLHARDAVMHKGRNGWFAFPFSIYAGWLSVATIANVSFALSASGYRGGVLGELNWTTIMLSAAATLGAFIHMRYKDIIFPTAILWGTFSIFIKHLENYPLASRVALLISIILFSWMLVTFLVSLFRISTLRSQSQ
jgi:benzodiazapine receptor